MSKQAERCFGQVAYQTVNDNMMIIGLKNKYRGGGRDEWRNEPD